MSDPALPNPLQKSPLTKNRSLILRLTGTVLAIILLVLLFSKEWEEIRTSFARIVSWRLLAALGLVLLSRLCVIGRWYTLLRSAGVAITPWQAITLTFTGLFSSNFLPTTIGGDVVRLAGAMQMGYDRPTCLASIAADRLIGMAGMTTALPLGIGPVWTMLQSGNLQAISLIGLWQRGWGFVKRTLQALTLWAKSPSALFTALLFTWGHMTCTFLTILILVDGLGEHIPFWMIAGLWSVSYFITLIPISVNGYGLQELSISILFTNAGGLNMATSLTLAVLMRILTMTASLPGAFFLPAIMAGLDRSQKDSA
jgi:uncharacterized membrane protein YbhN (UPF0104 family)